jgi:hypothetical protein
MSVTGMILPHVERIEAAARGSLGVSEPRPDLKPTLARFNTAGSIKDNPARDNHNGGFGSMYAMTARGTAEIVLYVVMSQAQ